MNSELSNLYLFARMLWKVALLTGLGPGILWATLRASRTTFRVRKVSGWAVSHTNRDGLIPALSNREATSPPRKTRTRRRAA
jgi:hypothetical protein